MPSFVWVVLLGAGVGLIAGMFGVGGGFLLTPLLTVVFGLPLPIAAGTGLCQMIGTALISFLRHRQLGSGEIRFDLFMLAGSLVGVDAGVRVLAYLAGAGSWRGAPLVSTVAGGVYVFILAAAAALFWIEGGHPVTDAPLARVRLGPTVRMPAVGRPVSVLVVAYVGLSLGFLSGLLGIGGGVALLPVLVYGFGFPIRQSAGTGILVLLGTAGYGTFVHALHGHVDLGLAVALLIGGTPFARLGALLTARLPAAALRRAFALVVLATTAAVAWNVVRKLT